MKKILIISSNRLGDSILSSGINSYFRSLYKESQIIFVCGPTPSELFISCKNISKVITLKKKKYSIHWILLWIKVFFNLWDCVVDLRGTAISYFLITKKRKVFSSKVKNKNDHKIVNYSKLVGKKILKPNLNLNENSNSNEYLKLIRNVKKKNPIIAVSASANWKGKQWPKSRYRKLIFELKKKKKFSNFKFVLLGSKDEIIDSSEISQGFSSKDVYNYVGLVPLSDVFLIIKECNLFIGNDSGLMHLSVAAGTPTIGLFGPSDINQYGPWGNNNLAISTPESPNQLMGGENFHHRNTSSLMLGLTTKKVEEKIIRFYEELIK